MSSLMNKLKAFARTPRARALMEKARYAATKPENRRRLEALKARVKRRR
jgi:hypothetical protein